jgi:hypothetical protein
LLARIDKIKARAGLLNKAYNERSEQQQLMSCILLAKIDKIKARSEA